MGRPRSKFIDVENGAIQSVLLSLRPMSLKWARKNSRTRPRLHGGLGTTTNEVTMEENQTFIIANDLN